MSKRELLLQVLRNQPAERVPVGFWFHCTPDELVDGMSDRRMIEENLEGHRRFYREFEPDFIKIMTDGFFRYPSEVFLNAREPSELRRMRSIGKDHPWIEKQVEFAKTLTGIFGSELMSFYTIFAPATLFKFARNKSGVSPDRVLADFMLADSAATARALEIAAGDLAVLAERVIREGGVDGVYFSAQEVSDSRIEPALYGAVIAPSDLRALEGANAAGQYNILHICGYTGHRNDISRFASYPAQIINWAAAFEGLPLGEGKRLFGGRPVIGGFDNTAEGLLYRGSREEIEAETDRLLDEAGTAGVILGADCTLPRDINLDHLRRVRDRAAAYTPRF
jgi:uroporphyrinogen decarboxylase